MPNPCPHMGACGHCHQRYRALADELARVKAELVRAQQAAAAREQTAARG